MQPAAELLQGRRAPLELLGQGQQQQQHVGQQEDGELEGGWEQPAGVESWGKEALKSGLPSKYWAWDYINALDL